MAVRCQQRHGLMDLLASDGITEVPYPLNARPYTCKYWDREDTSYVGRFVRKRFGKERIWGRVVGDFAPRPGHTKRRIRVRYIRGECETMSINQLSAIIQLKSTRLMSLEDTESLRDQWVKRHSKHDKAVKLGLTSQRLGATKSIKGFSVTTVNVVHGTGVISRRSFKVGDAIIMGCGKIIVHDKGMDSDVIPHAYSMVRAGYPQFDLDMTCDAASNLVKYVNTAHGSEGLSSNCQVKWCGPVAMLYCTAAISVDDELLADYEFTFFGSHRRKYEAHG